MNWKENFNRPEFFSKISKNHFLVLSRLNDKKFFYEVKNNKIKVVSKKLKDFLIVQKENFDVFVVSNCSRKIFIKKLNGNLSEIYKFKKKVKFLDGCFYKKNEQIFLTDEISKSIFILDLKTKKLKEKKIFFNEIKIEPYAINVDCERIYVSDRKLNFIFNL